MRRTLRVAAVAAAVCFGGNAAEAIEWHKQIPATDYGYAVAIGANGHIHVVGTNGGHPSTFDGFVITFDRDGKELWRRKAGARLYQYDSAHAVATDADGNVYVAGEVRGRIVGLPKGKSDAFLIKFDPDGRYVWKRQPGTTEDDRAYGVATDADGNVYVVGRTEGALGGPLTGVWDGFVIKFDSDGRYVWKRQPDEGVGAVATDSEGNVLIVGSGVVIKLDRDGQYVWKRQPGIGTRSVATDAQGNIYVAGGNTDAVVTKFDRDGRYVWRKQFGTRSTEYASGVATDSEGNSYVVGYADGTLFGQNKYGEDAFVVKFDPDGRYLWKHQPTSRYLYHSASGVALDQDGNTYVVGTAEEPEYKDIDRNAFLFKYGPDGPQ